MSDAPAPGLDQLQELPLPALPSYWPQTWGWAVLAAVLLAGIGWAALRGWRRYRRNLYRRQAIQALDRLKQEIRVDPLAVRELPDLLKRTALAAQTEGQRYGVAALHGHGWFDYLQHSAGREVFPAHSERMLSTLAYAPDETVRALDRETLNQLIVASRQWVEHHHVAA